MAYIKQLKTRITEAINDTNDEKLLDLIYKLLLAETDE